MPFTKKFCDGEGLPTLAENPVSEATDGVMIGTGGLTVPLTPSVDVVAPVALICTVALLSPNGAVLVWRTYIVTGWPVRPPPDIGNVSEEEKLILFVESSKLVVAGLNCTVAFAAVNAVPLSWNVPAGDGKGWAVFNAFRLTWLLIVK